MMTLGSLFDGIAGFLLAGALRGGCDRADCEVGRP